MMHEDTLIHDVLSFLPDWGLKREYKSTPVQQYTHSYAQAFLEDSEECKDQLYTAKRVTAQEIYEEFRNSENYVLSYIHHDEIPHEEDMYYSLCKYTAGSLYLKYTQENSKKTHGNYLRKEALNVIDKYIRVDVHDVGHGSKRRISYPKWFLDTQTDPFWMQTPPCVPPPHYSAPPKPKHKRPEPRPKEYTKPYIIVETKKRQHKLQIETEKQPFYQARIETRRSPKKCHKIPFSARDGETIVCRR